MPRQTAMMAHNVDKSQRELIRLAATEVPLEHDWRDWLPGTAVNQEAVQCGVCHQEHHGANHDLRFVSDAQCQTCHQDRFGDFATSHPDFGSWPYGRESSLSFNHATHAGKHFLASKTNETFDCTRCHEITPAGEITRVTSYEVACASCHDKGLQLEAAEGVELVALPMLEQALAAQIDGWPESATGFNEGRVSSLTQVLLRRDESIATLLKVFPERDFAKLDPNSSQGVEVGVPVARAIAGLLREIAVEGQPGFSRRFSKGNETHPSETMLTPLFRSFPPQLVEDALERWWPKQFKHGDPQSNRSTELSSKFKHAKYQLDDVLLSDDGALADDSLLDPLADSDLLAGSAPAPSTRSPRRFDPDRMMRQGGWYRDDVRLAIRYRGAGHADPVLTTAIELAASLKANDPARLDLLESRFAKACLECHDRVGSEMSGHPVQWETSPWSGRLDQFTKFSHRPHLNIASLVNCKECHQVASLPETNNSAHVGVHSDDQWSPQSPEFKPLRRIMCASCHHEKAAGEACIDCHRYHIGAIPSLDGLTGSSSP